MANTKSIYKLAAEFEEKLNSQKEEEFRKKIMTIHEKWFETRYSYNFEENFTSFLMDVKKLGGMSTRRYNECLEYLSYCFFKTPSDEVMELLTFKDLLSNNAIQELNILTNLYNDIDKPYRQLFEFSNNDGFIKNEKALVKSIEIMSKIFEHLDRLTKELPYSKEAYNIFKSTL